MTSAKDIQQISATAIDQTKAMDYIQGQVKVIAEQGHFCIRFPLAWLPEDADTEKISVRLKQLGFKVTLDEEDLILDWSELKEEKYGTKRSNLHGRK